MKHFMIFPESCLFLQDKEQALIAISDNAKRCVESSRANRSKIYNLLLREFR